MNLDDYPLPLPPEFYSQVLTHSATGGRWFLTLYLDSNQTRKHGVLNSSHLTTFGPMSEVDAHDLKRALLGKIKPIRRLLGWYTTYL